MGRLLKHYFMHKFILLAFYLLLISSFGLAQGKGRQDVVYVKNHWVLRGKLLDSADSVVRIQTQDGNIFVFRRAEIEKITSEVSWDRSAGARKGFHNFTELGPLIAGKTTINGVTTAAFSFQTFLGYTLKSWLIPGLGAGADLYATETILPLFASLRGDLSRSGGIIPFYFGDVGYGANITQHSSEGQQFSGGLLYAAGAGVKIPFNRGAGFLLSLGYRYQGTSYILNSVRQDMDYRRLALRAGFYF